MKRTLKHDRPYCVGRDAFEHEERAKTATSISCIHGLDIRLYALDWTKLDASDVLSRLNRVLGYSALQDRLETAE